MPATAVIWPSVYVSRLGSAVTMRCHYILAWEVFSRERVHADINCRFLTYERARSKGKNGLNARMARIFERNENTDGL